MIICNNIVVETKDGTETYKFRSYNNSLIECSDGIDVIFKHKKNIFISYSKHIFKHVYQKKHGTYYIDLTDEKNTSIRFERDDTLNTISRLCFFDLFQEINFTEIDYYHTEKCNNFYSKENALKYIEDEKLHIHILDHENKISKNSFFKIYYDADVKFKDEYLELVECLSSSIYESEKVHISYSLENNVLIDFTVMFFTCYDVFPEDFFD